MNRPSLDVDALGAPGLAMKAVIALAPTKPVTFETSTPKTPFGPPVVVSWPWAATPEASVKVKSRGAAPAGAADRAAMEREAATHALFKLTIVQLPKGHSS